MRLLWLLSALSAFRGRGSRAMMLNAVQLPPGPMGGASVRSPAYQGRRKRSWVWNQFFVLEEFTGDEPLYVGKLHSDLDTGDGQVRYVLTGEGAASIFTIDESTGDIHATRRLDREQQAYYTLRAQARDRLTNRLLEPESQFVIKVQDVNDNQPRFLDGPYTARVAERSPVGTSVVAVVATDADDPTYGNSARLTYSILEGQPYFSVEPKTGVVRTALPDLDREAKDTHLLVVQAKDMIGQIGGLSGSTSVTVIVTDVNDNPPRFPRRSYQFSVLEAEPVSAVVARIRAVDLDQGPNADVDYRILDGDGLGTFGITTDPHRQEGVITLLQTLDFETKSSYRLRVEVSNLHVDARFLSLGPFSDVASVRLLVQNVDEPPVFRSSVSRMVVSEAAAVGTEVGSVLARDPDGTGSPIRYSIDRMSNPERCFSIDVHTGVIRTAQPLDRETVAVHNISVVASESLDLSQTGRALVLISVTDVNDNAPSFTPQEDAFVCKDAEAGQLVQTLRAVDRDDPEEEQHFLFSLSAEADGNLSFSLRDNQDNTASILTRGGGFLQRDGRVHVLRVVVADSVSPSLSSTTTLSISVCTCDATGQPQSCRQGAPVLLLLSLQTTVSAAVLTCVLTLTGVAVVMVTVRRRRREPLVVHEGGVQENIVCYDDEGGGEEDTEAFSMLAFSMLALRPLSRRGQSEQNKSRAQVATPASHALFQQLMEQRLQQAALDSAAPPYDSLQTYAFEGSASSAASLSSLNSLRSSTSQDSQQNYHFLKEWGPRFRKLADLYGNQEGGGTTL